MLWATPLLVALSGLLLYYQTNHSLWSMRLLPVFLYVCHPVLLLALFEYCLRLFLTYYSSGLSSSSSSLWLPTSSVNIEGSDSFGLADESYRTTIKPLAENLLLILIIGVLQYGYFSITFLLILGYCSLSLFQGTSLFLCLLVCYIFRRYRTLPAADTLFTTTIVSYESSKAYSSFFPYTIILLRSILSVGAVMYYAPVPPRTSSALAVSFSTTNPVSSTDLFAMDTTNVQYLSINVFLPYVYKQLTLLEFNVHNIEPEMSPLWYLFNEIFLRSMPYFTIIIYAQLFFYAIPLGMRLFFFPTGAILCTVAFTSVFDPTINYTLLRLPVILALMMTSPTVIHEMKNTTFWFGMHYFSYFASFFMKNLWLSNGNIRGGNANFMFNQHLIFNLCNGALIAEYTGAILRLYRMLRKVKKD